MNGIAFYSHATVALSFQIEIYNSDRKKSTSLYQKSEFLPKIDLQGLITPIDDKLWIFCHKVTLHDF